MLSRCAPVCLSMADQPNFQISAFCGYLQLSLFRVTSFLVLYDGRIFIPVSSRTTEIPGTEGEPLSRSILALDTQPRYLELAATVPSSRRSRRFRADFPSQRYQTDSPCERDLPAQCRLNCRLSIRHSSSPSYRIHQPSKRCFWIRLMLTRIRAIPF